ncbi:LysR family transcriptional regulator [Streptodolium elevatio]|uniref:LysR family transcriptional regulator n=1 Tax=Streptodolium elevatio TaxID=3157996 RepID=A0ABV3D864_9ACTN
MDLSAVRTFVVAADAGQFQEAAVALAITQQAVSKRIAALEDGLGVRLFTRTPRGARLTVDGQAFLPHARALLLAEERAAASVRPGSRPLRVDVIGRRTAAAGLLRDFHRTHPAVELDVVTLFHVDEAVDALRSGAIDATFRAVAAPGRRLPDDVEATPVLDEPLQLVTGPAHEFAGARVVAPAQLVGHRIWIPGAVPGTEWAAYYDELADTFELSIDAIGPDFGVESLLDTVADSPVVATLLSDRTPLVWPAGYDLRRIPLRDPSPVYPHFLLWHTANRHPGLAALRAHLTATRPQLVEGEAWKPTWARTAGRAGGTTG